ncbi:MAG: 2-C-methyl-D-erythritol 4-phosphate cytidylyltransferase, partial [Actinobacteria bacterium]|nr:2-C-methyl-D-erythritol 4-phosphate cytidylyltransferase [Actinomycetota bacterium]
DLSQIAKQFLHLAGESMLTRSLRVLDGCLGIDSIVVALPEDSATWPAKMDRFDKLVARTQGAATRQASLGRALEHVPGKTSVVLVHDAARPMLTAHLVDTLLSALDADCDGVIPAIPLEDTIKRVSGQMFVTESVDRNDVWRVQTPQVFDCAVLRKALNDAVVADVDATDCSHLLTRAGYRVRVVPGDPQNFKVTHPGDLVLAEAVLVRRGAI